MGKNLARMEIQVFLQELTRRLPHLRLAEQRFSYVANTSFRGPEHLWVEWDPARNPERTAPAVLEKTSPVRIGEPSKRDIARTMQVERVAPAADGIVRLRLVSPDGRDAAALDAGLAHRRRVRRHRTVAPVLAVRRSGRHQGVRDRGAARGREPRRLGLDARRGPAGRPAARQRAAQPLPPRRVGAAADLHRRRHRHHADRGDGAARPRARHRLRPALQRPPAREPWPWSTSSPRCTARGCIST